MDLMIKYTFLHLHPSTNILFTLIRYHNLTMNKTFFSIKL